MPGREQRAVARAEVSHTQEKVAPGLGSGQAPWARLHIEGRDRQACLQSKLWSVRPGSDPGLGGPKGQLEWPPGMASQALGGGKFPSWKRNAGGWQAAVMGLPCLASPKGRNYLPLPSCCPASCQGAQCGWGWCSETLSCLASSVKSPGEKSRHETSLNLTTKRLSY